MTIVGRFTAIPTCDSENRLWKRQSSRLPDSISDRRAGLRLSLPPRFSVDQPDGFIAGADSSMSKAQRVLQ